MEDDAEALLSKWRARWEEERELQSITASGAITANEDGAEVVSKAAQRDFVVEIGALVAEEARETTVLEVPSEVAPTETIPSEVIVEDKAEAASVTKEVAPSSDA